MIKNLEKSPSFGLGAQDKKQIDYALAELFFGLTRANWVQGMDLGAARYKGIALVKSYLSTKNPDNPVVQYMNQQVMKKQPEISKTIMTSVRSSDKFKLSPEKEQETTQWGAKWVNDALGKLNPMVERFERTKGAREKSQYQNQMQNAQSKVIDMRPGKIAVEINGAPGELPPEQLEQLKQAITRKIFENQYGKVA